MTLARIALEFLAVIAFMLFVCELVDKLDKWGMLP